VLDNVDLFLAQTDDDRRRLIEIGAPQSRISVAGNLKFDVAVTPAQRQQGAALRALFGADRPVLMLASTRDGEEALLSAFSSILANHPKAVMILAPRHPERFATVAELVEKLGFRLWRRSLWSGES
jgi:3-deoxy-D-manno-octulosonic-acid transferase